MKKILALTLAAMILLVALAGCGSGQAAKAQVLARPGFPKTGVQYNQVSDDFRRSLWQFTAHTSAAALSAGADKNSLYSPMSLYYGLAMLEAGSAGQTKSDLRDFLAVSSDLALGEELGKLYALMTLDQKEATEQIANALWIREDLVGDKGVGVKRAWLDQLANDFYAAAFAADFGDPETSGMMSDWVAEQTRGKIKPQVDLSDPQLLLVMMNTVYFKANWREAFSESASFRNEFHGLDEVLEEVPYLKGSFDSVSVLLSETYTAGQLSFQKGKMILVLPEEGRTPEDLLEEEDFLLDLVYGNWGGAALEIELPKFSYRTRMDILEAMEAIGLTAIVTGSPDLSAMLDLEAEVSAINQETYIALDEKGVEAAGYTEVQVRETGAFPAEGDTVYMTLNRPFLYLIVDDAGTPLFVGIVRNPLQG